MPQPSAWFHFVGDDPITETEIAAELAIAGVQLSSINSIDARDYGVVCFANVSNTLLTFLRETKASTGCRLLALAASASAMHGADSWSLLSAGAAEVLTWSKGLGVAAQISARLERWIAIDLLTKSAFVKESLVGRSLVWRNLVRQVVEAACFTNSPILFTGESGTGKELLARLVHQLDRRSSELRIPRRDLVTVDCTTIAPELSGSELFGHERGAFTGAVSPREGAFALADGATLFLDEVGELPLGLQAQLLRAIQEKTYKRVGGNVWQTTDFRLVCATNRDLIHAADRGEFRVDLYYRIAGSVFRTPPLRERPEDILPLAAHFLKTFRPGEDPHEFDEPVREYLLQRRYPGNVRELRQLVQRIAHRHAGPGPITVGDVPEDDRPSPGEKPDAWPDEHLDKAIAHAIALGAGLKEINHITAETAIRIAVQSEQGSLQRAAKRLGVTDRALQMRKASEALRK
jgi:transcriptional regulator with GAF, ATPase, and Fis domain